jgi:hypothetical protein
MPALMPKTATSKGSTTRRIALAVVVVVQTVIAYFGVRMMWGLMMLGYVDSAIGRMRVLYAAENQFAKEHPARGYTCELSELPQSSEIRRLSRALADKPNRILRSLDELSDFASSGLQ